MKEIELKTIKLEMNNTETLINSLRQQRHDHINHIQTISSMLILNEHDEAQSYISGIANKYKFTGSIIRLGNPTLTALINTKKAVSEKYDTELIIHSGCKVNLQRIKPWELSSIMSNLIDNAFDEVVKLDKLNRKVELNVSKSANGRGYEFTLTNPLCTSTTVDIDSIFSQGYSTKASKGRGYGLHIVKELVSKNNGTIDANLKKKSIEFKVYLED